uniref:Uncharacterized protein n=1 Tax=viral metagenome TaxID=1070528 RepID=A0A6C0JKV8_9ZZZZ
MKKFKKHITKRKTKRSLCRKTRKNIKGGVNLYKTLIGLLVLLSTAKEGESIRIKPRFSSSVLKTASGVPPPPKKPGRSIVSASFDSERRKLTDKQLADIATGEIGRKFQQDKAENLVVSNIERVIGEHFDRKIEDIVKEIKENKSNSDTTELLEKLKLEVAEKVHF